jgi:hypothetical protein
MAKPSLHRPGYTYNTELPSATDEKSAIFHKFRPSGVSGRYDWADALRMSSVTMEVLALTG